MVRVLALLVTAAIVLTSASYLFTLIFAAESGSGIGAGLAAYAAEDEGSADGAEAAVGTEAAVTAAETDSAAPAQDDPALEQRLSDIRAQEKIEMLSSLINYLRMNYKDSLDLNDLANGAIEGIMEVLGDKYSQYYHAEDVSMEELFSDLENQYAGVGVTITEEAGEAFIMDVNPDGPAYEAGIRAGGVITAIDGTSVQGKTLSEIAQMLRGEEGTLVRISVRSGDRTYAYSVTRRVIVSATVKSRMIDDKIGYIAVSSMSGATSTEFLQQKLILLNQNMKGLILDLRDNTGGYMETAINLANQLMDSGVISVYFKKGEPFQVIEATHDDMRKVPVVVLVNEHTASSAEMLTGALHDTLKAPLVGETTFGKGIAQSTVPLYNEDILRLSTFYFKTPNHHDIHGVGIRPDYVVHAAGNFTRSQANELAASVYPMKRSEEAKAGDISVNVLAAQQRLQIMGYGVIANARLDEATAAALKDIQKLEGLEETGELDKWTIRALASRFEDYLGLGKDASADPQLDKAVEVMKEMLDK